MAANLQQQPHQQIIVAPHQNMITSSIGPRQVTLNGANVVATTVPAGATIEIPGGGEVKQVVVDGGVTVEGGEIKPGTTATHLTMASNGQTFLVPLNGQASFRSVNFDAF